MQIVIPSRKRADTIAQRTLKLFPDAIVTVDEREMDDYRSICPKLVPHPPLETLAEIYNWIVDNTPDEIVVIADDDIKSCVSFTGRNTHVYCKPAEILQIVENCAEAAKGIGARLFGFSKSGNPKNFQPHDPFTFVENLYTVCGYVGKEVHSDPKRRLFRDCDTVLTELMNNRIIFCDSRFHFDSVAPMRQKGGNAVNRGKDDLRTAIKEFSRKWGQYVSPGKTGDLMLNRGAVRRRQ